MVDGVERDARAAEFEGRGTRFQTYLFTIVCSISILPVKGARQKGFRLLLQVTCISALWFSKICT